MGHCVVGTSGKLSIKSLGSCGLPRKCTRSQYQNIKHVGDSCFLEPELEFKPFYSKPILIYFCFCYFHSYGILFFNVGPICQVCNIVYKTASVLTVAMICKMNLVK